MDPRSNTNIDAGGPAGANIPDHTKGLNTHAHSASPHKTSSVLNLTSSTLLGIYSPSGYDSTRDEPTTPWGNGSQTPSLNASSDFPVFGSEAIAARIKENNTDNKSDVNHKRRSIHLHPQDHNRIPAIEKYLLLFLRTAILFLVGLAYGQAIAHLHDRGNIAPVKVDQIDRASWKYLVFWGVEGTLLGTLIPATDKILDQRQRNVSRHDSSEKSNHEYNRDEVSHSEASEPEYENHTRSNLSADWNPIVRSIGAFVGIAFAIVCMLFLFSAVLLVSSIFHSSLTILNQRRLPWQSTLQVSLTLALVNPFMWYLLDRTKVGFCFASALGITGALTLLGINPEWIPPPAIQPKSAAWSMLKQASPLHGTSQESDMMRVLPSHESIGVATWISSVLFCSCVFFGNLGRRFPTGQKDR